eukprot:g793.t1
MGQRVGKAEFIPEFQPFLNLPPECIKKLWVAFNDESEGFGLTEDDFYIICRSANLYEYMNTTTAKLKLQCKTLFTAFDTDDNGLVDALEVLCTFALVSGMSVQKKITFVFESFDFSESGFLSVDEMTLSFKSTLMGLSKMTGEELPTEQELEAQAAAAFLKADNNNDNRISHREFHLFCNTEREARSWVTMFDSAPDTAEIAPQELDSDLELESNFPERNADQDLMMGDDILATKEEPLEGDDLIAERPWMGTLVEPSNAPENDSSAPFESLQLEWVHGYRGSDCRNNLRYTNNGRILYHTASVGVLLTKSGAGNYQDFHIEHTDDIVSFAVWIPEDHSRTIVATGEVGRRPKVIVWDTAECETLCTIVGFHQGAVTQLAFSPEGDHLVTTGMDALNSVAVYRLTPKLDGSFRPEKIFTSNTSVNKILCAYWKDQENFVTCGVMHCDFWSIPPGEATFLRQKGLFGSRSKVQNVLCIEAHPNALGEHIITGTQHGELLIWEGRNVIKTIRAHDGSVHALYTIPNMGLVSGGKDGRVKLWNTKLQRGAEFDMNNIGSISSDVRSVAWEPEAHKLLVGTRGCEIFEISDTDGNDLNEAPLITSHFRNETWGLAIHPNRDTDEFCTSGDDGTIRTWNFKTHQMLQSVRMDCSCRAVAYSPDGSLIAAGMGSERKEKKTGSWCVVQAEDVTLLVHEGRDSASWISDIKFSPDGTALAVASTDFNIYSYSTQDWSFLCKADTHDHPITHFDFSRDSKTIQATDSGFIMFWHDAESGDHIRDTREVKNTAWDQVTCTLGWGVQGIWPNVCSGDSYRVNALHRDPKGKKLVATGDNYGFVNLFRYPTTETGAVPSTSHGHSAGVTNVRFSGDGKFVITCGGADQSVMQWKVVEDDAGDDSADEMSDDGDPTSDMEDEVKDGEEFDRDAIIERMHEGEMDFILLNPVGAEAAALRGEDENTIEDDEEEEDDKDIDENEEAEKPWLVNCLEPTVVPDDDATSPLLTLELDWIHGYSSFEMRSNLYYTKEGHVVYPAGQVGVVLNTDGWKQQFMAEHVDDISSLAISPNGKVVATANFSKSPSIIVWPCTFIASKSHLRPYVVLRGQHQRCVTCMRFSNGEGRMLATVGADENHRLIVYDWADSSVKARTKTGKEKICDVMFAPEGSEYFLVTAGMQSLKFWKRKGRNLMFERAIIGRKGIWQAFLCLGSIGKDVVVGTQDGHLYRFRGRKLLIAIKAHTGPVYTLHSVKKKGIASGGRDGVVKLWNLSLEVQRGFDVSKLKTKPVKADVRAVCWDPSEGKVLVGTKGAEIFEIDAQSGVDANGAPLICGHARWELHGLATHPSKQEFCTVGDDMTVRVWDCDDHKLKTLAQFDCHLRACEYSTDGSKIAVGMGGDIGEGKNKKDGAWMILHSSVLTVQAEAQDSLQPITDAKWSLDGQTLGFASTDRQVYLYDVQQDYQLRAQFNRNTAAVTHFDFTEDSEFLMTNSADGELLFANCEDGKLITNASALRDMKWASFTCPFSWPSQGLHHKHAAAAEINAMHRSNKGDYVCTVDTWGKLKLWRYPCVKLGKPYNIYEGHSSEATNVRWTADDKYVITTGGADRCIFQWRVDHDAVPIEMIGVEGVENIPIGNTDFIDPKPNAKGRMNMPGLRVDASGKQLNAIPTVTSKSFFGKSSARKKMKPWLAAIAEPEGEAAKHDPTAPAVELQLEHVYGYRIQDCRSNIFYNDGGEIVYPAAGVGIIYNKDTHSQKFYVGHDDDIISLAVSACANFVATGQIGEKPIVRIWDSESGQEIATCKEVHSQGIISVNFSPDSTKIVSVGCDAQHTIAVWQTSSGVWSDARFVAKAPGDVRKVFFASWIKGDLNSEYELVSGGIRHLKFWKVKGRILTPKRALFGQEVAKIQTQMCCAIITTSSGHKVVTGTFGGEIYVWTGRKCSSVVKQAHEGAVNSAYAPPDGSCFVTGGEDGRVKVWNSDLTIRAFYDMKLSKPVPQDVRIRSVAMDLRDCVVVGTAASEIYELFTQGGKAKSTQLVQGHYKDQLFGLATHPENPQLFVTSGDDKTVRLWNTKSKSASSVVRLDTMSRCVTFKRDGTHVCVGLGGNVGVGKQRKDGAFCVFDAQDLSLVHEGRPSKEWLTDIAYDNDGKRLVMGSRDGKLYVLSSKDYEVQSVLDKATGPIMDLDISADGRHVQCTSEKGELLFYETQVEGLQITQASVLKDTEWATWTCTLGWPVQGLHRDLGDNVDLNACHRSKDQSLVASADSDGRVRVFRYPSVSSQKSECVEGKGHSSHVTKVRFTADDSRLLSIGGLDRSVMQWKIVQKSEMEDDEFN